MRLEVRPEERYKEALQQVLSSRLFAEAPVQSKLLGYLAARAFAGTAEELKEYSIGVELFLKPDSYSPQMDPSVRVQTSRLRTRLDEYYRTEGLDSATIIRLPKGSYNLVFETRHPEIDSGGNAEPLPSIAPPPPESRKVRWGRTALIAAFISLVTAIVYQGALIQGLRREVLESRLDPYVERLWHPLVSSPRPLTIVIGMPLWLRLKNGYFRHISVSSPGDIQSSEVVQRIFQLAGEKPDRVEYGFNGLGETVNAFLLGRLFLSARKPVTVSRSNTLSWEELRSRDVVLIGSSKSNPHLRDMPMLVNYRLVRGGIQVLHPAKGEPDWYRPTLNAKDETVADYALVARLPGIGGNGYVMILGAESTAGNWAAADVMSDPRQARQLVSRLADRDGNVPELFELIVRAEFQSMVPVKIDYVAHRVITRQPVSP